MSVLLPVERVVRLCNPYKANSSPWGAPITIQMVTEAIAVQRFVTVPGEVDHVGRIAYLVEHKAEDPIEVDIGVPSLGCNVAWPVTDGNHRLAAAIFRRDVEIACNVAGSLEYAWELFGVDCSELFT